MEVLQYGNPESSAVLIQPVDDHDLAIIENEIGEIRNTVNSDFEILAFKVHSWNHDLSPWEAPAVFGRDGKGEGRPSGAAATRAALAETARREAPFPDVPPLGSTRCLWQRRLWQRCAGHTGRNTETLRGQFKNISYRRIFARRPVCDLGCLPDRCVQGRSGSVTLCMVSALHGIHAGAFD